MIERALTPRLLDALGDRPVTLLAGARQSGKSTLALVRRQWRPPGAVSYVYDSPTLAGAAGAPSASSPATTKTSYSTRSTLVSAALPFAESRRRPRSPARADSFSPGRRKCCCCRRLSESLAGRMEILTLWPLAQYEITRRWRFVHRHGLRWGVRRRPTARCRSVRAADSRRHAPSDRARRFPRSTDPARRAAPQRLVRVVRHDDPAARRARHREC